MYKAEAIALNPFSPVFVQLLVSYNFLCIIVCWCVFVNNFFLLTRLEINVLIEYIL